MWVAGRVVTGRVAVRDHPWFLPLGLVAAVGFVQWIAAIARPGGAPAADELPRLSPFLLATASPWMTKSALVQVLAYGVLLFLTVQAVSRRYLRHGVLVLVASAALPTIYGLIQYATGDPRIFGYVNRYYPARFFGTFINANHFATFVGMAACVAAGALAGWVVPKERRQLERGRGSAVVVSLVGLVLGAATAIFVAALLLTRSRAGVVSAALGLGVLLSSLAGLWRGRGWGGIVAGAWVAASAVGLWLTPPVRERLLALLDQPWNEGRVAAWEATLRMASAAPLFGTGLGTYRAVFPHFQQSSLPPDLFQNAAHNDLLELLATLGVAGLAVAVWGLWRSIAWAVRSFRGADRFGQSVALGILSALLVLFLHSLTDFPLRTPANAVLAVAAAGLLPAALGRDAVRETSRVLGVRGRAAVLVVAGALLALPAATVAREALAERLDRTEDVADEVILSAPPGDEARLLQSRALDPERARYPIRLAELYAVRGYRHVQDGATGEARDWLERAARQYERAIRLDPWRALPRARLAWLQGVADATSSGPPQISEAFAGFGAAMALEPRNPYPPRLLALWALRRAASLNAEDAPGRGELLDIGYAAARRALLIQPALLPELAGAALELSQDYRNLSRLLPEGPSSRLALAQFLNERSLRLEGTHPEDSRRLWAAAGPAFEDGIAAAARLGRADALARAHAAYARALLQHHLAAQALSLVEKGRVAGDTPELAGLEAQALVALGRLDEAEPAYRRAVALAARLGETGTRLHLLEELARLYERMRLPERALAAWREVLGASPGEGEAHVGMARAWDALGQPERALGEYRLAVEVAPHDAGVRSRVAAALFQRGLYDEAMRHRAILVQDHPDDSDAHLRLAESQERLGDLAAARRHYVEALKLAPGNPLAQSALARLGRSPSSP